MFFRMGDLVKISHGADKDIECSIISESSDNGCWQVRPTEKEKKLSFLYPPEFGISLESCWYEESSLIMVKPVFHCEDKVRILPVSYSGKRNVSQAEHINKEGTIIKMEGASSIIRLDATKQEVKILNSLLERKKVVLRSDKFLFKPGQVIVYKYGEQKLYGVVATSPNNKPLSEFIYIKKSQTSEPVKIARKDVLNVISFPEITKQLKSRIESLDTKKELKEKFKQLNILKNQKEVSVEIKKRVINDLRRTIKDLSRVKQTYFFNPCRKFSRPEGVSLIGFAKTLPFNFVDYLYTKQQDNLRTAPIKNVLGTNVPFNNGVYLDKDTFVKLKNNSTCKTSGSQKPMIPKTNYIGLELEIITKKNVNDMVSVFTLAGLARTVTIATDGSINTTKEHPYAHELRILFKEDNMDLIFGKLKKALDACSATVNDSCGLHVHLDMRNRNAAVCYNRLANAYPFISKIVKQSRINNRYCLPPKETHLEKALQTQTRYYAINCQSIERHKTIEVRLHHGSIDLVETKHWIETLLSIIKTKGKSHDINRFILGLKNYSKENQEMFRKRIEQFKTA